MPPTHNAPAEATATASSRHLPRLLLACWLGLTVYGTLFPLTGWRIPAASTWLLNPAAYHDISSPDVLANVLLYMPFGFLCALQRRWRVIVPCLLLALVISLCLETAQMFLPGRVSSLLDTALNVFGTGVGAVAALVIAWPRAIVSDHVAAQLRRDRVAWLGIAALAVWAGAQLLPFVPSLDVGNIRTGLKPLWHAWQGLRPISPWRCCVYVAATAALTISGASILRIPRWNGLVAAGLLAVLPLKPFVVGRQLSPEALIGTLAGVTLGIVLLGCGYRRALYAAALLIPAYIGAEALQPGLPTAATHAFNWVPLHSQFAQPLNGLANLADAIWPLLVLACLCRRLGLRMLWHLLPAIVLLLFGVEWAQCGIAGRYPDITTVLAGAVTWAGAAAYTGRQQIRKNTPKA